jgi:hypothetical protein
MSEVIPAATAVETAPVTATAEVVATPAVDMFGTALAEITNNEGKPKYSDVPAALDGLKNAQEHIAKLEADNATLRAGATEAATIEQLMAKLDVPREAQTAPTGVSIEDVAGVARQTLADAKAHEAAVMNMNSVESEMAKRYGSEAQTRIAEKASEIGMSLDELKSLALRSPKAFLAQFPTSVPQGTPTPANLQALNIEALTTGVRRETAIKVPENVMHGAKTSDVKALWHSIGAQITQNQ